MFRESWRIWGASTKPRFFGDLFFCSPKITSDFTRWINQDWLRSVRDAGRRGVEDQPYLWRCHHQIPPASPQWMSGESGDFYVLPHTHIYNYMYINIYIYIDGSSHLYTYCLSIYGAWLLAVPYTYLYSSVWWHVFEIHVRYQHEDCIYIIYVIYRYQIWTSANLFHVVLYLFPPWTPRIDTRTKNIISKLEWSPLTSNHFEFQSKIIDQKLSLIHDDWTCWTFVIHVNLTALKKLIQLRHFEIDHRVPISHILQSIHTIILTPTSTTTFSTYSDSG